jgi:ABC-type Mn2+/Zn2+ transport system ATPase subunit
MNAFTTNYEYIKSYGDGKGCMTLLLDELDKSMDISNVVRLYKEFLPAIQKKYGVQIIIVSHSPLMLSNIIQNNDAYNFISIDDKYTKEMKKLFEGVKF